MSPDDDDDIKQYLYLVECYFKYLTDINPEVRDHCCEKYAQKTHNQDVTEETR